MTTPKSHMRRGKGFETDLVKWLREKGYDAERIPLAGTHDEGDVAVRMAGDRYIVIEAKAPGAGNAISLSSWIKEAETEAGNFMKARNLKPEQVGYMLVIKARGKSLDEAYVVKKLGVLFK